MDIRKAVITAAGRHQRVLPVQTFVDRDGAEKTALQIIIEEVIDAGADEICLVVVPGDQETYAKAAGEPDGAGPPAAAGERPPQRQGAGMRMRETNWPFRQLAQVGAAFSPTPGTAHRRGVIGANLAFFWKSENRA
jgi:hypothetical protein